jgi:hypothetical protein
VTEEIGTAPRPARDRHERSRSAKCATAISGPVLAA